MTPRNQLFWDLHDFSKGRGLEVGPLHRPIVTTDMADVRYVDVLDREGLIRHYAADPDVTSESIPDIDYHLLQDDGRTLTLVEATKAGAPFDWVMASHVIEHVPDVIGWMGELAEVVADDGVLILAVPDKRYCFDVHRPASTVGQMVAAHYTQDRRPGVAAVYDYISSSVSYDLASLWRGDMPTFDQRIHTLEDARAHVERTLAGEYIDCHVWLFTPTSFLRQMHELRATGRSEWMVEGMEPTRVNELEFHVVMRRVPRGTDATAPLEGERLAGGDMPDWLEAQANGIKVEALEAEVARLQDRLERRGLRVERLRRRVRRQERRLHGLQTSPWLLPPRAGRSVARRLKRRFR